MHAPKGRQMPLVFGLYAYAASLPIDDTTRQHEVMKDIDLNLSATLEALLAERNVSHAARRLGLSQPALSSRLARLRDQ